MSFKEPGQINFCQLKVDRIVRETPASITISFLQETDKIIYKPGQFLTLIIPMEGVEKRRPYSLSSSPFFDSEITITVKRAMDGLVSNWLCDNLSEGDTVKVIKPMGDFTIDFNEKRRCHYILFAGGSGITPILSIIKSILIKEPDSTCSLIYCNRDIENIIFKDKLDYLESAFKGRLKIVHILTHPPAEWSGYSGKLSIEIADKIWAQIPDWGINNSKYLICGPEGLMNTVQSLLEYRKIPTDRIYKESFSPVSINRNHSIHTPALVSIQYQGKQYEMIVENNDTILDTALNYDIDLPFSCGHGICTTCKCKMLLGKVSVEGVTGLSKERKEQGYILPCVARPASDHIVIEY